MKGDNLVKHLLLVSVVVVTGYFGLFHLNEWLRTRRGAWEVSFVTENGTPTLTVTETALKIAGVKLRFPGESTTNIPAPVQWIFDDVTKTNLPFGTVIFNDLTYLPGTVTMDFFGHEIELIPRTLVVNRKQIAWEPNQTITLKPGEKLSRAPAPKENGRY